MAWNSSFSRSKSLADSCVQVINTDKNITNGQHYELLYQVILNNTDPDTCIYYAEKLIEISELSGNQLYLQRGYFQKGQAFIFKANFKESLIYLQKSLSIAQINHFNNEIGFSYYTLSQVYKQTNNCEQSINCILKSIEFFKKDVLNVGYLAGAFYQLGSIYFEEEKLDSSLFFFNKAVVDFSKLNNLQAIAYAKGNIGLIQQKFNQTDSARINLSYAIELLSELQEVNGVVLYCLHASQNELSDKKFGKALEYAQRSLDLKEQTGNIESHRDVYEQLSKVYVAMGDYEKAYHYQNDYYTLRDSLVNLDVVTQMANLRTDFEVGQKQVEVDLLEKTNQAKNRVVLIMVLGLFVVSVLLIVIFISYRHKMQLNNKLQEQKKKLAARKVEMEEANNAKDRLFSVISHDLRGPVGSLKNLATLIVQSLDDHNLKDAGELAFSMSESSQQVEFLLDNLLHWSISRQNLYKPKKEAFELNRLVNEVINVYVQTARAKEIQLTYNPCYSSITIESDSNCWATIIRNLVNNAIKFTPVGGNVCVTSCYNNGFVRIEVTDNGLGMNSEQIENLFNFVGKVSEWGTKNERGQGLGLCLVNDFVKMQDGSIEIESEYGKGSKFIVTIPATLIQKGERVVQMQLS